MPSGEILMGQQVEAHCRNCDYSIKASIGGMRSNFHVYDPFPAICKNCNQITCVNRRSRPLACLNCESIDIIEYGDETRLAGSVPETTEASDSTWMMKVSWEAGKHLCPKCKSYSIEFATRRMFFD